MAILLILIFWELSKIRALLKKARLGEKEFGKRRDEIAETKVA